jgi:phosphopantothenoylcysteine decarboxylase/phosphopantothenate--cysteine ligase
MAGQNIILGVTGGIAAYKAPELVRRLTERGASVQVVMTASAREFVTETTLQAVSGRAVRHNLWDKEAEAAMGHIELARWADLVLIAPITAEVMSRLAAGSAGDLLTTLCLATEAPLVIAPAMNHVMWSNPAVQANRKTLEERGIRILGPAVGDQACGETGPGRMLQPEEIVAEVIRPSIVATTEQSQRPLRGRTVMVTAGPTREEIDPVRYISNRSSGKMGYAIAEAALVAGARVKLISGPVALTSPDGVEVVHIETAEQLFAAAHEHIDGVDIFIAAATVADYRPAAKESRKIKKKQSEMTVRLVKAPDTLASIAKLKNGPFAVGFAAETDKLRDYALGKLESKQLDMIVANQVGAGKGFDRDDNAVEVFWNGGEKAIPLAAKTEVASQLVDLIAKHYNSRHESKNNVSAIAATE